MKAGVLVSRILLLTVILSLLFTIIQATKYKAVNTEVNAEDILKHIENGDDVNLANLSHSW